MAKIRVHLSAPDAFFRENRAKKGELKKRAMRLLAARCKDEAFNVLQEVGDPQLADACFRILMTDGQWRIRKERT